MSEQPTQLYRIRNGDPCTAMFAFGVRDSVEHVASCFEAVEPTELPFLWCVVHSERECEHDDDTTPHCHDINEREDYRLCDVQRVALMRIGEPA